MNNFIFTIAVLPLLVQSTTPTAAPSLTGDPVRDVAIIILGILGVFILPRATSKVNEFRESVEKFQKVTSANAQSVSGLNTDVDALKKRVTQLEADLSKAIQERDEAKSQAIAIQAAREAAQQYADAQIRSLKEDNLKLNSDLITERIVKSELANTITELRQEIATLKERCEMLENAGPIADAIADRLLKMNTQT